MYDPGPSDAELAAWGVKRSDVEDTTPCEVWEENWIPYQVFEQMRRQWRMGPGGPTGLDYAALFPIMKMLGIKTKKQKRVVGCVRVMENEALTVMLK